MPQCPALIEKLAAAIREAASSPRPSHKRWHRRASLASTEQLCSYCQAPLEFSKRGQVVLSYLIPPQLGGPLSSANRVLSCTACARSKGELDVLAWPGRVPLAPEVRARLLVQRQALLLQCLHHLTPHAPSVSPALVTETLDQRFQKPRFLAYACLTEEGGFIGWPEQSSDASPLAQAAVLLRFHARALDVSTGGVRLYQLSHETFLSAAWLLIEEGGMLSPLSIAGASAPPTGSDWRHAWQFRFDNLRALVRRRGRGHAQAAPHQPRELASSSKAAWKRKRYAQLRQENDKRAYLEEKARLDRLLSQEGEKLSVREIHEKTRALLELKARALGLPAAKL